MNDKSQAKKLWESAQATWNKLPDFWENSKAHSDKFIKGTQSIINKLPNWSSDDQPIDERDDLNKSLSKTQNDLDKLLNEKKLSSKSREILAEDRNQLNRIIEKLENQQFHIAVFGRVSVGKSSLLNALLGKAHFSTSVLHGETKITEGIEWTVRQDHALHFIDTPGIDEYDGKVREDIARQAVNAADMVLFVVDGDLTQQEFDALAYAKTLVKSLIVVVNKADRLSPTEIDEIRESIAKKLGKLSENSYIPIHFVAAEPRAKDIIKVDSEGNETVVITKPDSYIDELKAEIWQILNEGGHQLQALSAAMFATQLTGKIGEEIVSARADVANDIIKKYCIGKALAVGLNPIPLLDMTVVVGDIAMIKHLASAYGFEVNSREATSLMKSVITELGLVLGASFGVQALSSVLKGLSVGLSTILTASAQGIAAYYGTYLVGKACEEYFKKGAGWGEDGAKKVLEEMLKEIDKDTVLAEAKADIQRVLKIND